MPPASRALLRPSVTIACLLALTAALIVWQHAGMNRRLDLASDAIVGVDARDDRPEGGASHATVLQTPGSVELDCTLSRQYAWPYCGIYFGLGEGAQGVDMSAFDTVTLDLAYDGPPPRSLRLYLHNFEPGLSQVGQWQTQKVNEIEFAVPPDGHIVIPLKLLHTATWWIAAQQPPLMRTAPQRDNITSVDLYTGSLNAAGRHRWTVRALRFDGKWVSQKELYAGLLAMWGTGGLLYVLAAVLGYRRHLRDARRHLAALSGINKALRLEAAELAEQVHVDELTGTLNRPGLRDLLARQLRTPGLIEQPCSLLFVDLDHFKRINDTHGHLAGDQVLRAFADLARQSIRLSDKLVRWGGEEFLVICPGTDAQQALLFAHKLRATIEDHAWPGGLPVTASFGVATLAAHEDFGAALDRADRALLRAKSNGRNTVAVERAAPAAHAA